MAEMNQTALMDKIRALSFALVETNLFLDGHPRNRAALRYFQRQKTELNRLVKEYEQRFCPMTAMGVQSENEWNWVTCPWPWQSEQEAAEGYMPPVAEGEEEE